MAILTAGQLQALSELRWISRATRDRITVDSTRDSDDAGTTLLNVWLTIDCRQTSAKPPYGLELGDRQTFVVDVPTDFPYRPPSVQSTHAEFAGLPHVMWQRGICLYTSPNDWDPSQGMWGFVDRLVMWLIRASSGTLAGPALPWHPPVTARRSWLEPLVIMADLPSECEDDAGLWIHWARMDLIGDNHFELKTWLRHPSVDDLLTQFVAPIIGLPHPVGFEYPHETSELLRVLDEQGLAPERCHQLLRRAASLNDPELPIVLLVGSPAPRGTSPITRVAHLAAWHVGFGAEEAGTITDLTQNYHEVLWVTLFDQRPSIAVRRDVSRPVSWLAGKRVLLLGCGALGAPISEHCARAGANELYLVDNGIVQPGILVRQPYEYVDIGRCKTEAMADRLNRIAPAATVVDFVGDAVCLEDNMLTRYDLVIDSTANRGVSERLEYLWRTSSELRPPIITVAVGHQCEHAVVTVALPASSGAGVDVMRRLAVAALDDEGLSDFLEDFYPMFPRIEVFQPEPGCSDPTFVGSSADLAAFAGQLLNAALGVITDTSAAERVTTTRAAVVIRQPTSAMASPLTRSLQWRNDKVLRDATSGYEIRIDSAAFAAMRRESIRARELDHGRCEAGGVLLGQIDPACRVVWVTRALGQGPSDDASAAHVRIDVDAIRDQLIAVARNARGVLGFVGAWHSHPGGYAMPSNEDDDTMQRAVADARAVPAVLSLILGGAADVWDGWLCGLRLPDVHVQMYFTG
jgi:proteasome lid subunit RPN8/RPN11